MASRGDKVLIATIVAASLVVTSLATASPPGNAKAMKPAAAAPAKKKPAKSRPQTPAEAQASKPLTAESLGLGGMSLSAIKAAEAAESAPAEPAPAPAPPPPPPPAAEEPTPPLFTASDQRDQAAAPPRPTPRRVTLQINPLPIAGGRYGLDVDLVLARHHAIFASAWFQTFTSQTLRVLMPKAVDVSRGADALPGGELGYRWYSGDRGANGLFIGFSGVAMPIALPRYAPDLRSEVVSFLAYGGAVDIGGQHITSSGFTFGLGVGAMGLAFKTPTSAGPPPGAAPLKYMSPHVLPRLLLTAGWSF